MIRGITKVVSGALLTLTAAPAIYTHLLFGYAEQDSAAQNFWLPSQLAALAFLIICLHCGLTVFSSGVRQLRESSS